MKFSIAPLCVLLCASSLRSQTSSATLGETVDWLKKNLGGVACVAFQMGPSRKELKQVTENTEVQFSDCNMTLATAATNGPSSEIRTFHLPLGQLNLSGVTLIKGFKIPSGWIATGEVPSYTIRVAAPGGAGIEAELEQFGKGDSRPSEYRATEVNLLVLQKDSADKLVTALSRAIALCRGK